MNRANTILSRLRNRHLIGQLSAFFFNTRIRSLYGGQTKALKKIASGIDRACLILASHHNPLGLLLYKLNPTNEFAQYGVRSSLEVKTLALLNAENPKIKGKGLGKKLLEKCYSLALAKCASGVHLTVSEHSNVLGFYKKQGFDEKHTFKNKCGATEYLLFKPLVIPEE